MRLRVVLAVFASLVLLAAVGVYAVVRGLSSGLPLRIPVQECVVNVNGTATFDPEQLANAATIAAVGIRRGLPAPAIVVALATAQQESKLENLSGGDRDSIGLFQQRPSQGWGTVAQLRDPVYAATEFYQKLEKLPNWDTLPITEAAQAVQRSGAPDAYAQWEPQSRAMAAAFNGQFPAVLTCRNLTLAAPADLAAAATEELGAARLSGAHPAGQGWTYATWLVGRAEALGIDKVSFAGQTWTAESGAWAADSAAGPDLSVHQTAAAEVSQ